MDVKNPQKICLKNGAFLAEAKFKPKKKPLELVIGQVATMKKNLSRTTYWTFSNLFFISSNVLILRLVQNDEMIFFESKFNALQNGN